MSSYNFDKKIVTAHFTIDIDTKANYGYFEHNTDGDNTGGGLWFSDKELVDYDGVFELPKEVAHALRNDGYIVAED